MKVHHDDADLERLESDPEFTAGLDKGLVRAFCKVLNLARGVSNEVGLYKWRGLNFEKLKGKRAHQRSIRLNDQWRLIVEIEEEDDGNVLVVKGIEDYH